MISKLKEEHVDKIIEIHILAFPESQSTKFGKSFLKSYYLGACNGKNTCAFVFLEDKQPVGFIFGGISKQEQSMQILMQSKASFLKSFLVNLIKHPFTTIGKFYNYFLHYIIPGKDEFYNDKTATLDSVAVLDQYRGKGIADALIKYFLNDLENKSIEACRLGVLAENTAARKFYERNGFEQANPEGTIYIYYTPHANRMNYKKFHQKI